MNTFLSREEAAAAERQSTEAALKREAEKTAEEEARRAKAEASREHAAKQQRETELRETLGLDKVGGAASCMNSCSPNHAVGDGGPEAGAGAPSHLQDCEGSGYFGPANLHGFFK